jgi:hypothetical protein
MARTFIVHRRGAGNWTRLAAQAMYCNVEGAPAKSTVTAAPFCFGDAPGSIGVPASPPIPADMEAHPGVHSKEHANTCRLCISGGVAHCVLFREG